MRKERFNWEVQDTKISQCAFCKHKNIGKTCTAFKVIPDEILTNAIDHRVSYAGDNGIQFEPNENVSTSDIDYLFELPEIE